jgi:hypothetical protein
MLFWTFIVERNQNLNNQFSRVKNQAYMSAYRRKRTYALQKVVSALPSKADMCGALANVR